MQRATPLDTSLRSYVSGGARGVVHEADDTKLMQEVKVNFTKNEMRDKVERPQPYGFTGYCRKAKSDKDGQIEDCAEHFTQFMGGNRALPVCASLDDRRYRLRNFKEGETAIYDDQQQKVHLQRGRILARSQHKVELRVVKDQKYMNGHGLDQSASRDQYSYPDPMPDHSRRWSTIVMDKDAITIERTNIIKDDDKDDPQKHTQDEPESKDGKCDEHIVMLSRVYLDAMHIHIFTPTISILWDEETRKLVLNTGRNIMEFNDPDKFIQINTSEDDPTQPLRTMRYDDKDQFIIISSPDKYIKIDDQGNKIQLHTPNTDVVLDEVAKKVKVGDASAKVPAAMLGSLTSDGAVIIGNVAKKVLVK